MVDSRGEYISGFIERRKDGTFEGTITIEGIDLSPIRATMFKEDDIVYLWLRRKDILEYNIDEQRYIARKREPRWEAYLKKQMGEGVVAFKGEFNLMRFKFSIVGVWDSVFGKEKSRLNLFVDRLPDSRQEILQRIKQRNNKRI